jgi:single-stranded DNA-binding protein
MFSITVLGNLVADPKEVGKDMDTTVARLRLAYDEPNEGTGFVTVLAYGKTAESALEWLEKGRPVCVFGRLRYNEDSQGEKHVVVANTIKFLGRGNGQAHADESDQGETEGHSTAVSDEAEAVTA